MKFFNIKQIQDVEMIQAGSSPIGRPFMTTNFYLIDNVLIDTGLSHRRGPINEFLNDRKVDMVLLTHHHEDHSGNAHSIKERFGCIVYCHEKGINKLANGFNIMFYQRYIWGKAEPVLCEVLPREINSNRFNFKAIHTPGHSKDHVVYLVPERGYLFSGDLYLADRVKYFRSDEWILDQINSLKKVLRYDFEVLFCGHRPRLNKGREHLRAKLEYLENLYGEISNLFNRGYTEREIIKKLGLKEVWSIKLFTQGNVSVRNIVRSVIRSIKNNTD